MQHGSILLPLLVQVLLTLLLYAALAFAKARAVKAGQVDSDRRALHDDAWPESVMKINNNIRNQFQLPVLFYVLVVLLWQLGESGVLVQTLAWLFVGSRIAHAWVHTHSNYVPVRRRVFAFGWLVLVVMLAITLRALIT